MPAFWTLYSLDKSTTEISYIMLWLWESMESQRILCGFAKCINIDQKGIINQKYIFRYEN